MPVGKLNWALLPGIAAFFIYIAKKLRSRTEKEEECSDSSSTSEESIISSSRSEASLYSLREGSSDVEDTEFLHPQYSLTTCENYVMQTQNKSESRSMDVNASKSGYAQRAVATSQKCAQQRQPSMYPSNEYSAQYTSYSTNRTNTEPKQTNRECAYVNRSANRQPVRPTQCAMQYTTNRSTSPVRALQRMPPRPVVSRQYASGTAERTPYYSNTYDSDNVVDIFDTYFYDLIHRIEVTINMLHGIQNYFHYVRQNMQQFKQ